MGGKIKKEESQKPEFIDYRIEMFDKLKAIYDQKIAEMPRVEIEITLPNGTVVQGTSYETTPMMIAQSLSKSLSERVVIAKVSRN
jgi:threonyl-tRNA synthetase